MHNPLEVLAQSVTPETVAARIGAVPACEVAAEAIRKADADARRIAEVFATVAYPPAFRGLRLLEVAR